MNEFVIRLARLEDEAAVRALSAHIWEGDDYVPDTFADWVADPLGRFYLLFVADRLAGFGKLTCLTAQEWWLEGLRVHPDFRGQGIARTLHNYAIRLAEEIVGGTQIVGGTLRFATASTNLATHHLAASTGFTLVSRHWVALAAAQPPSPGAPQVFQPAGLGDHDAAAGWLAQTAVQQVTADLYEDGWQWLSLPPALPALLTANKLYWWRDKRGLVIVDIAHDPEQPDTAWVNLAVTLNAAEMPALLTDLRQLAAHLGKQTVKYKAPSLPQMKAWLAAAGWELGDDLEMFVFARPLPAPSNG